MHLSHMRKRLIFRKGTFFSFAVLAPLTATSEPSQGASDCRAVPDSLRTPSAARLAAGSYALTIIATAGGKPGTQASGTLTLRETVSTNRSSRTGRLPRSDENRSATPLWGYIDADLASVGAPLPDGNNPDEPQPTSRDPIYPGLLVHIQNWGSLTLPQQYVLTVGTTYNVRVRLHYAVADGPGILMNVRQITIKGFRGTWQQGGLVVAGGYFCAVRLP